MNNEDRDTQTLIKLGFTPLEAKIFFTMYSLGRESVAKISATANIDRSNTAHMIKRLQKVGLVQQILGKPTLYEPISFNEAISVLVGLKEEEFKAIRKEAKELADSKDFHYSSTQDKYDVKLIGGQKKTSEQDVIYSIKNVAVSFDLMMSNRVFIDYFINLSEYQLDCVKQGIEYRVITELENIKQNKKKVHSFLKYPNFHLRYITGPLRAEIGITDKTSAGLVLTPFEPLRTSNRLVTDHSGLVYVFQSYFDKIWNEAQEYKPADSVITEQVMVKKRKLQTNFRN